MPNDATQIEIITCRERRRRRSAEQTLVLVEEITQPDTTVSAVAFRRGVSPRQLLKWRQLMSRGGQLAVKVDDVLAASRAREIKQHVR